eukprot:IDg3603t1
MKRLSLRAIAYLALVALFFEMRQRAKTASRIDDPEGCYTKSDSGVCAVFPRSDRSRNGWDFSALMCLENDL